MSKRLVKPEKVKTLQDWAFRWPAADNLGFDPETREPVVYSSAKVEDRSIVARFPWKREGDIMTILTKSDQFAPTAVEAARKRLATIRERRSAMETAAAEPLRTAERVLLEAWRAYREADPVTRDTLRRDVLTAEKTLRDLEVALAEQTKEERQVVSRSFVQTEGTDAIGRYVYVPPIPAKKQGLPLQEVAGAP